MKKLVSMLVMTICLFTSLQASNSMMLFTGNANHELAEKVADYLQIPLGAALVDRFNDGEIQIRIDESVRGKDIILLQPCCQSKTQGVNDNLMELYLLTRTMKRASAASITAVIPYYGYARQDRKTTSRVPISAADVALMLEMAGIDRIITVDLHCGQIQGFFRDVAVDNLFTAPLFASYFSTKNLTNVVVVSPDAGGVERAKRFSEALNEKGVETSMALISKERAKAGVIAAMNLIGDVQGADAIIIDDLCDTGGTLVKAVQLLKDKGANRVFAVVTHPVFSNAALDKIKDSALEEMVIADTIPLRGKVPSNVHVISVASLLGEAILCVQYGRSISALFE